MYILKPIPSDDCFLDFEIDEKEGKEYCRIGAKDKNSRMIKAIRKMECELNILKELLVFCLQEEEKRDESNDNIMVLETALRRVLLVGKVGQLYGQENTQSNSYLYSMQFQQKVISYKMKYQFILGVDDNIAMHQLNKLIRNHLTKFLEKKERKLVESSNEFMDTDLPIDLSINKENYRYLKRLEKRRRVLDDDVRIRLGLIKSKKQQVNELCLKSLQLLNDYQEEIEIQDMKQSIESVKNSELQLKLFTNNTIRWSNEMSSKLKNSSQYSKLQRQFETTKKQVEELGRQNLEYKQIRKDIDQDEEYKSIVQQNIELMKQINQL